MGITVDARGLDCPIPVINTKKVMELNPEEEIITIVNNDAARENVKKLAENSGYQVVIKEKDGDYYLYLSKGSCSEITTVQDNCLGEYVIYVPTDKMGQGADELGRVLMKSYFYALTESKPYPAAILFVNSGVNLTVEGSDVLDYLNILGEKGVELLSCGTCLDFFHIKEKLAIGSITNMYTIVEKMNAASKAIRI